MVGVKGAEMACESLLGSCVAESDLTRRCEIIFPDAETVMFGSVPAGSGAQDLADMPLRTSARPSVGVGGVTVVCGALMVVLGGVFGATISEGTARLMVEAVPLILLRCGFVTALSSVRGLDGSSMLFELVISFPNGEITPGVFLLPVDVSSARSGLIGEPSPVLPEPDVNIFLILLPGEMARPLFEAAVDVVPRDFSLCCPTNVVAWRGAKSTRDEDVWSGIESALGFGAVEGFKLDVSTVEALGGSVV